MKFLKRGAGLPALALAAAPLLAPVAEAFDVSVSGFIRQEMAYKINSAENENNRGGSKYNGKSYYSRGQKFGIPLGTQLNHKVDKSADNDWNVFATKAEIDVKVNLTNNLSGFMRIRGYYQPDVFDGVDDSAFIDGEGGRVNHFNMEVHGNEATYLSMSDNNYMVDLPSFYLDWAKGPYWVRIGQQQIAWGESLFFRVADQANGLDYRRHFIFDFGAEEYADERLAAPAIRASMTFAQDWEIEVYAQMFQPTVLPNNYSPYNIITNGFNQNYEEAYDRVQDNINAGIRLRGQIGNLGVQFFAISQHNANPIFDLGAGGQELVPAAVCADPNVPAASKAFCGFETQPFIFEAGGIGTTNPDEWSYLSAISGSDGTDLINGLVGDWDWIAQFTQSLGLVPDANGDIITTIEGGGPNGGVNTVDFLELFFATPINDPVSGERLNSLSGNLDAHYASENVFGFGFNYIFYAEPDTFMDQLVVRFEASYTPDKKFTNNLRQEFKEEDELLTSLVLEKYHRFSDAFPATFFVFQWMHRKETDLLERHLSGLGGSTHKRPGGGEQDHGWDGLVFAFQQPFPGLIWRVDLSVLYDMEGGHMIQPGVRYKPSADWTIEMFANFIDGRRSSSLQPFDHSDDLSLRLTYQF
ncbi:MAG: hypothetical protein KBT88_09455 [Gammaproteobacteria bacterium]|nr:hypothetical protein [Gammaproteobacteria bacterium]MBQ0840001.1 hypothetical protein [Gammaproteobacteria bacterium]